MKSHKYKEALMSSLIFLLPSLGIASDATDFFCLSPTSIKDDTLRRVLSPLEPIPSSAQTQRTTAQSPSIQVGDAVYWVLTPEYDLYDNFKGYRGGSSGIVRDISCAWNDPQDCSVTFEHPFLGGNGGSVHYHASSRDGIWTIDIKGKRGGQLFTVKMSELIKASNTFLVPRRRGQSVEMTPVPFKPKMQVLVIGDSIGGELTRILGTYSGVSNGKPKQIVEIQSKIAATPREVKPKERVLLPEESLTLPVKTRGSTRIVHLAKGSSFIEDSKITHLFHDSLTQKSYVITWKANSASEVQYSIDRDGSIRKYDRGEPL